MHDYLECGLVDAMSRSVAIFGFRVKQVADVLNPDLVRASEKKDSWW
jgi:hypothetical protein